MFDYKIAAVFDDNADNAYKTVLEWGKLFKDESSPENPDPSYGNNVSARHLVGDIIRYAIKTGLVNINEDTIYHIANSGSFSHDDTVSSLEKANKEAKKRFK